MGMKDWFKNFVSIPSDDEYEDDEILLDEENDDNDYNNIKSSYDAHQQTEPQQKKSGFGDFFASKNSAAKSSNVSGAQVQVVLVKPQRYDEAPDIADHLNAHKTVVLNLEDADSLTSRRLLDFLSGTAYADNCSIKKIANGTYMIAPKNVDVLGELVSDDFESDSIFSGF